MPARILLALAAAGFSLQAAELGRGPQYTVSVCMETAGSTEGYASGLVSKMFAGIDVEIQWRRPRNCPSDAVRVTLQYLTLPSQMPRALAYALPYEGTHIVVFFDRVQRAVEPRHVPKLAAHVIAHEIAHLLEGVIQHSPTGIMKARWNEEDLSELAWKPLPFAPRDVLLIHQGLQTRSAALLRTP